MSLIHLYNRTILHYDKKNFYIKYIVYFFVSIFPVLLAFLLSSFDLLEFKSFLDYWIPLNFSGMMLGAFILINLIYMKGINYYESFIYLVKNDKKTIEDSYKKMYGFPKGQLICSLTIGVLCTTTGVTLGLNLQGFVLWYIIFWSFMVGFVVGWGMWYTIALTNFITKVTSFENLNLNPIISKRSLGIWELEKLSTYWAICFFFEFVLVFSGLYFAGWKGEMVDVKTTQIFWLTIFIVIQIFNYLYPKRRIKNVIYKNRMRYLIDLQNKIETTWNDLILNSKNSSDLSTSLENYSKLYKVIRIDEKYSQELSTILAIWGTIIIPLSLIIVEKHEVIIRFLKTIFFFN